MKERKTESEKTLERRLQIRVKGMGGLCLKFIPDQHRGLPDRIVLMSGGCTAFAEIKTTGRKPEPLQEHMHEKLRDLGFTVAVIDSSESLEQFISEIQK